MRERFTLRFALAALALASVTPTAAAQSTLRVTAPPPIVPTRTNGGGAVAAATVVIENAFSDRRSEELLISGFPARISTTVELWHDRGWFDALLQTEQWQRLVKYNVLNKTYLAARVDPVGDTLVVEGRFSTIEEVRTWMAIPRSPTRTPPRGMNRLYYAATVTIDLLNGGDLAEVQRWLRGEVQPTIRGEANPGSAIVRTFRTIFARFLGGDTKRMQKSSDRFDTD